MARLLTQIGERVYSKDLENDGDEEWVSLECNDKWVGTKEYSDITMENFINDYIMPNTE